MVMDEQREFYVAPETNLFELLLIKGIIHLQQGALFAHRDCPLL